MPKVLFVVAHRPGRSPSQRFRFEQYVSFLENSNFECHFSYLISEKDDDVFYRHGNFFPKVFIACKGAFRRLRDVMRASRYEIIFVQREAFMTGSAFFEKMFSRSKAKLIFDFDDAIWMLDTSDANKNFEWLKNPQKTACIIAMSDLVIAGNRYLADYACKHNSRVVVIPTTINTREHRKSDIVKKNNSICIGWSGSITTIKHFGQVVPVLKKIKHKYGDRVRFKVIGDESYVNEELGIKGIAWNLQDEVKELSELDIGLMPLPHDEWAKGKCGLKALLYMAMEIPAVISPVGVNGEIIRDGSNGFLAAKEVEWEQKISRLVESKELRESLGRAGRKTVEEKYSVEVNRSKYLECFRTVLNV